MKKIIFIFAIFLFILPHSFEIKEIKNFYGACAPKSVSISPNGHYAAIMNLECLNFWLIDVNKLRIIKKIRFFRTPAKGWDYKKNIAINSYAQKPVESCFSNDSRYLWISLHNAMSVIVYDTLEETIPSFIKNYEKITVMDLIHHKTYKKKVIKIRTEKTPKVIAITPNGKYALVSNWHGHSISIIDTKKYKNIKNIPMRGEFNYIPRGIAISSDSQRAYIANMRGGTISIIDLNKFEVIDDIWVTSNPRHLVLTKDNKYLYISDNIGGKVIKFDVVKKKKMAEVKSGKYVRTIALSPDEKYVYAASYGGNFIGVIRTSTMTLIKKIPFPSPMGLAISPDGTKLFVSSYKKGIIRVYKIKE